MTIEEVTSARFYVQNKKYKQGIKYIQDLLATSPNDDGLHAFLAIYYCQLGQLNESVKAIATAISLNPIECAHYQLAAKIQMQLQNADKAIDHLNRAIAFNPNDANIFGDLSSLYVIKRNFDKALELANNGLSIDPTNAKCLRAKALVLSFLGQQDEAKHISDFLLGDNPINAQNLFTDGLISLTHGDESSTEMLSSALFKQPNNPFFQNAYKVSLRNKLPGYNTIQKVARNLGQKGSNEAHLIGIIYSTFILFCIANLYSSELGFKNAIPWLSIYLIFWNINLIHPLIMIIPMGIYDFWLYISNRRSRYLFNTTQTISTLLIMVLLILSFSFYINAYASITSYLISLHIIPFITLIYQVLNSSHSAKYWSISYVIITIVIAIFSIYEFNQSTVYFIISNIIFRILPLAYHKISTLFK
ncbi:hypothetical protein V6R21_08070 [Limibacter armeniacum]|uniref:tetratricopeptide repeat protein n=1 Tax=Limibacter armeniacum TaxID=466084 RepID=UPI002FE647D4